MLQKIILLVLYGIIKLVQIGLLLLALVFLLALVNTSLGPFSSLKNITQVEKQYTRPVDKQLRTIFPKKWVEYPYLIALRLVLVLVLASYCKHLTLNILSLRKKMNLKSWQKAHSGISNDLMDELNSKLIQLDANPSQKQSKTLIKEIEVLKERIDSSTKELAFLAIDIVDSTGLKTAQEKTLVYLDFKQYKNMVQKVFAIYHCISSAWTPDGVMSCFSSVDDAILAAKRILELLDEFNRNQKRIKSDFNIRCGINAGSVYFDASTPLEEMTDNVIDIAGHMQKYADPNAIALSKEMHRMSQQALDFQKADKVVDGYSVYQWKHN